MSTTADTDTEQQPLLAHQSPDLYTTPKSSSPRRLLYGLGIVVLLLAIIALISLPLALVERPINNPLNDTALNSTDGDDDLISGSGSGLNSTDGDDDLISGSGSGFLEEEFVELDGTLVNSAANKNILLVVQAEDRLPPPLPTEQFNVCDDPFFKCKWVTGEGEIRAEADAAQRKLWMEVAATSSVSEEGHQTAAEIVRRMMLHMPRELYQALVPIAKAGTFSKQDKPTVFPEYAALRDTVECQGRCDAECAGTCFGNGQKFDSLSGIGKIRGVETALNVQCSEGDPYSSLDNGLLHEFSHTIHKYGLPYVSGDWWNKILAAYDAAKEKGTWDVTSNAMSNYEEYWAKGTGVFFNTIHTDVTGGMNSCGKPVGEFCSCPEEGRAWLSLKDPALLDALLYAYGNDDGKADLHICMNKPNNVNCQL